MNIEKITESKSCKKKATFELDATLHKTLKQQSVVEERSMVEILEEALKNYLKTR